MIHIYEILAFALCFATVIYYHKRVAAQPGNKPIAVFSTVVATISILTLITAYSWSFYSENIDWSFIGSDWQEINTKAWNDVNYIKDQTGQIIMMVAAVTNPVLVPFVFTLAMGAAMNGDPQLSDQTHILILFIAPVLFSIAVYIGLSNLVAKGIRKVYRDIKAIKV